MHLLFHNPTTGAVVVFDGPVADPDSVLPSGAWHGFTPGPALPGGMAVPAGAPAPLDVPGRWWAIGG